MKITNRMMAFNVVLAMVIPVTLIACPANPPGSPQGDAEAGPATSDDARDEAHLTSCGAACGHQRGLHCILGDPTPHGATCEAVCAEVQAHGGVGFDTRCLATVPSCEASTTCR